MVVYFLEAVYFFLAASFAQVFVAPSVNPFFFFILFYQLNPLDQATIQVTQNIHAITTQATMASTTASQVFNITELAESILIHADDLQLQTTLPRVSKQIRNVIAGSVKLQRRIHNPKHPLWDHPTISPAPISTAILSWTTSYHEDGRFPHEDPPQVPSNCTYQRHVHFEAKGLDWACDKTSTDSQPFRSMLVCQPPIIAVDTMCFSQTNYRPCPKMGRIENPNGITCGELFDHVKAQAPVAGQISLSLIFRPADAVVSSTS
jgi:hypothetical protein